MNAVTNEVLPARQLGMYQSNARSDSSGTRVYKIGPLNEWQVATLKKIAGFELLKNNWDSYGSQAPSWGVADAAVDLVVMVPIDNVPSPSVIPISGGGIQLVWAKGRRELQVEVGPDQAIEFLKIEDNELLGDSEPLDPPTVASVEQILAWVNAG